MLFHRLSRLGSRIVKELPRGKLCLNLFAVFNWICSLLLVVEAELMYCLRGLTLPLCIVFGR